MLFGQFGRVWWCGAFVVLLVSLVAFHGWSWSWVSVME